MGSDRFVFRGKKRAGSPSGRAEGEAYGASVSGKRFFGLRNLPGALLESRIQRAEQREGNEGSEVGGTHAGATTRYSSALTGTSCHSGPDAGPVIFHGATFKSVFSSPPFLAAAPCGVEGVGMRREVSGGRMGSGDEASGGRREMRGARSREARAFEDAPPASSRDRT
jgi:hypothetical protein